MSDPTPPPRDPWPWLVLLGPVLGFLIGLGFLLTILATGL